MARKDGPVEIKQLDIRHIIVPIEGLTPLIVHKWSEKAKREMREKQAQRAKTKKEPKDPQTEFEASMYRFPDGRHGFPAVAFKAAIIGACRMFDDVTMVAAKTAIRVMGDPETDLIEIHADEPIMREDMVRIGMGTADIRYRAEYRNWSAELPITFIANMVSEEQLINLIDAAGFGGVGEWRPSAPKSATGSYGCFRVRRSE